MNWRRRLGGTAGIGWLLGAAVAGALGCARQVVSTQTALPGGAAPPSVEATGPSSIGANSPRGAIEAFLKAANAQDLQAMSGLWGTANGLARDQFKRDELEKRLIVMQCLVEHDRVSFPEERSRLNTGGRQEFLVELAKGPAVARTTFVTVQGPGGRWLVEDFDVTKLREFCR